MNYYNLKSVFNSGKTPFTLRTPLPSFSVAEPSIKPYVDPSFEKIEFETEKPTVILVSAVGATGKTALAQQLSRETKLPILDLSKHKPVGDNTLTGLLTGAFNIKEISGVFEGLSCGSYGLIIDGLDEARSKTTGKAFEAFLDDIVKLCKTSTTTTFLMLGRTNIVDDCWVYISSQGIPTALISIAPFAIESAVKYIDAFTNGLSSPHKAHYIAVRDLIINRLGKAFTASHKNGSKDFLGFIGYPPVLDAIVTLLTNERNYHKLLEGINDSGGKNVEISLLQHISEYILDRERSLKVIPNIVQPLIAGVPDEIARTTLSTAYMDEEQCARLVAYCLGRPLTIPVISENILNDKYEEQLVTWLPEHPFIAGHEFRNAVFEALAIAKLISAKTDSYDNIIADYIATHKHSYYLVYMLESVSVDCKIKVSHLNAVLLSAMEFRSAHSFVELRVVGPEGNEEINGNNGALEVEIYIEIILGETGENTKTFSFTTDIEAATCLKIGPRIAGTFISVPCKVAIIGDEVEITAPVEVNCSVVQLNAKQLVIKPTHIREGINEVIITAKRAESSVESISTGGTTFELALEDTGGLSYPIIRYVETITIPSLDPLMKEKYFRLKRILLEFRSHSRGSMARYRQKIEAERVLRNDIGRAVLKRLLNDNVLSLLGRFYHLDPEGLSRHLGVTWHNLRKGQIPDSLSAYLRSIEA
ncbi:MAG: hypothetical protein IH588_12645 [Anaerolineales bacterium]|nr:hypothetical protein [Anaerolineales bacterium]